jgi:hypothetical protein
LGLPQLWKQIRADLRRARSTLPEDASRSSIIPQYEESLNHHGLALACEMLEAYAENQTVNQDFWLALRDAVAKMQLADRARRSEELASVK